MKKLRCAVVDDDALMLQIIKDMCKNSQVAEISFTYDNPRKFLDALPKLDFDLCLLDIQMPELEGLVLAQLIGDKPVIFITGTDNKFKEALDLSPIDIITKPIKKERLEKALTKAHHLISEKRQYGLFNISEGKGKAKIKLEDIVIIKVDNDAPRNKKVVLRDGSKFTLMDYSLEDLLGIAPNLVQVSKSEVVSLDDVARVERDIIHFKAVHGKNKNLTAILGDTYRKSFLDKMHVIK
jgi:two-component system LytT family response regulator